MKSIKLFIFTVCLLAGTAQAGWIRTYGDDRWEQGKCAQETNDGGYIATGLIGSPAIAWFFKTDSLGNILWSDTTAGGNWVEQTNDGGYILAGVPDLSKTDSLGDTLWTRDYGIYSVCTKATSDGG